ELREQRREQRVENAQPVTEWMEDERDRILNERDLIDDVKKTYESSMRMSRQFAEFYREFWDLPAEFGFDLSEKAETSLENRFATGLKRKWNNPTEGHETWWNVGRDDEPAVPYTWSADRSITDLSGPSASFGEATPKRATDDD
ncbi:MAG: acetone carboxylase alpha subunit, partial [Halovenus sp.]